MQYKIYRVGKIMENKPCSCCMEYKRAYEYEANMNQIYRSVLRNLLAKLNNSEYDDGHGGTGLPPPRIEPRDSVTELEEDTM